jgi:hypothetical protein
MERAGDILHWMFLSKVHKPKKRRRHRFLKGVKIVFILILMGMIYSLGIAVAENIQVNRMIANFKERSVFETEVTIEYSTNRFQTRRYYKVSRETSYELEDTRSVFYDQTRKFLGQSGDIFVSQDSPFPDTPLVHSFISYYFGGHAALKTSDNRFIEAVGFPDDDESILDFILRPGNEPHNFSATVSKSPSNYWLNPNYRTESDSSYPYYGTRYRNDFIGLRVKGVTQDQIDGAIQYGEDQLDQSLYNFLFFLDMTYKYYCTDLVSRAYQSVMVEESKQRNYSRALNDDRFITSVNDMVLSRDTYMIFYVEVIEDIWHIYYLEDLEG